MSRLPGARATEYKAIARKLGEIGIVDPDFSRYELQAMAGYRNRLTHFYADITPEEIFNIVQKHSQDFARFLTAIQSLLSNPASFDLDIE